MGEEIVNQAQDAKRVAYRVSMRRNMPRHILIKLSKTKYKKKSIKSSKGKTTNTIQGNPDKVHS